MFTAIERCGGALVRAQLRLEKFNQCHGVAASMECEMWEALVVDTVLNRHTTGLSSAAPVAECPARVPVSGGGISSLAGVGLTDEPDTLSQTCSL